MPKKLLIADDDPISLHVITTYLREANYPFITAEDGQKALELLQQNPADYAAVIADRIMPKLHGLELLTKMKSNPQLKSLPMIMLTGEAEKAEMVEAIKAGVFDFLFKPVEKELLISILRRVFR